MNKFARKLDREKKDHWKKSKRKRNRMRKEYMKYVESLPDDDPKKEGLLKELGIVKKEDAEI